MAAFSPSINMGMVCREHEKTGVGMMTPFTLLLPTLSFFCPFGRSRGVPLHDSRPSRRPPRALDPAVVELAFFHILTRSTLSPVVAVRFELLQCCVLCHSSNILSSSLKHIDDLTPKCLLELQILLGIIAHVELPLQALQDDILVLLAYSRS